MKVKLSQGPRWGNPAHGRPSRVQLRLADGWRPPTPSVRVDQEPWLPPFRVERGDRQAWLGRYEEWLAHQPDLCERARRQLGGRHLLCPCAQGAPCHGDTLLRIANQPEIRKDQQ